MNILPGEIFRLDFLNNFDGYSLSKYPDDDKITGKLKPGDEFMVLDSFVNEHKVTFVHVILLSRVDYAVGWLIANYNCDWGNINKFNLWLKKHDFK